MVGDRLILLGMVAVMAAALGSPVLADTTQLPVMRLETKIEVAASPAKVWSYMTTGKNLVTWCPYWKDSENVGVNLTKVGDVLNFSDSWGNGGSSIVTYLDRNKEIRVAHEPADGSYLCQSRLLLQSSGTGTRVLYVEQYTDESAPEERSSTAANMRQEMRKTLTTLKTGVEGE